jgi:hypothetical protein
MRHYHGQTSHVHLGGDVPHDHGAIRRGRSPWESMPGIVKLLLTIGAVIVGAFIVKWAYTASLGGGSSVTVSCSLSSDAYGKPEWVATFTNPTSSDITINSYTALFFDQAGNQTGSEAPTKFPVITIAAHNSAPDTEGWPLPVPSGSTSCKVTDVQTG